MARDVAEQVQRMGREPGVTLRAFDRAVAQASRRVEPVEPQTGATERVVAPDTLDQDTPLLRLTLEELLGFPEPVQRLATLAQLRQCPGGGGGPPGMVEEVRRPAHRDPALNR